jgi:hypothetical protein
MGTTTNTHTTKTSPMLARRTAGRLQSGRNTARVSGPSVDSGASGAMGTVWSGRTGKDRRALFAFGVGAGAATGCP